MIDILLSTYNGEHYIREQIESILSQTYTDWRLIIRDDMSSDGTIDIINEYVSNFSDKIFLLKSNGNMGCKNSFQELLKVSTSKYIMFSDQDDIWMPNKIEDSIRNIKTEEVKFPNIPIICCSDLIVVDETLNIKHNSFWAYSKISVNLLNSVRMLSVNNFVTGCTMIMNDAAKFVCLPFGKYAILHDSYISLKVLSVGGRISIINQPTIYYRQHKNNKVGATEIKYSIQYFLLKIFSIPFVLKHQYKNYKQANEVCGISIFLFLFYRIIYLLKR